MDEVLEEAERAVFEIPRRGTPPTSGTSARSSAKPSSRSRSSTTVQTRTWWASIRDSTNSTGSWAGSSREA